LRSGRDALLHSVAEPNQNPTFTTGTRKHGVTEKNRGKTKSKAKTKSKPESGRETKRKFRGEWKSMKIFVKREDFKG